MMIVQHELSHLGFGMMERMRVMTLLRKTRVIVSFWTASSEVVA